MPRYQWEAKPPLTRPDVFGGPEAIEVGTIKAADDEDAIRWLERMFARFSVCPPLTMRVSTDGRTVRTMKTTPGSGS